MPVKTLERGDRVFWTDPDEGVSSGWYIVVWFDDENEEAELVNEDGSETGALYHELSFTEPPKGS